MAEVSEHVNSLAKTKNDNGVDSVPPRQGDKRQVDLLALAKEGSRRVDSMASAREDNAQADSLAPSKEDSENVDSLAPAKEDSQKVDSLALTTEENVRVDSLAPTKEDNGRVDSLAPTKGDNGRVDSLAPTKEDNGRVDSLAPTKEDSGRVDSLAPTKEDNERVDSLAPTKEDNGRVDSLAPTKEDPVIKELVTDVEKVDVAADTVVTPTKLTLMYSKDTPAALSNFFPKFTRKVSLQECCHIARHDDAHVYLNGDGMSRNFGQIYPVDGDVSKFILMNVSKNKIIQVVYSKGKKTMSKILKFNESMPIQTNYLIKFHTLEFKVEITPGDVSSEHYELEVVQEVPRRQDESASRSSPVIVNKGQINRLYMASNPVDTNSGPVHMAMSNYGPPTAVPYHYPYCGTFQGGMPQNSPNYSPGQPHGQFHAPQNFMTNQRHYYDLEHPSYQGHTNQHSQGQMNNGFPLGINGHFGNGSYGVGNPVRHMGNGPSGPHMPTHPIGNYAHSANNAHVMQPRADAAFRGYPPYYMGYPHGHPLQAVGKGTSSFCPTPGLGDENWQYFYRTPETDSLVGAPGKVISNDPGPGWIGPRVAQEIVRAPVENSELPDPIARLMQKADP